MTRATAMVHMKFFLEEIDGFAQVRRRWLCQSVSCRFYCDIVNAKKNQFVFHVKYFLFLIVTQWNEAERDLRAGSRRNEAQKLSSQFKDRFLFLRRLFLRKQCQFSKIKNE